MALFRRRPADVAEVARLVLAEVAKGAVPGLGVLPAGVAPVDLTGAARAAASTALAGVGLPRDQFQAVAFGPGVPLLPVSIDPREPGRQPEPRVSEFPVSVNLQLQGRHVPFAVLRDVADRVDVVRACIEARKAHLLGLDWDVRVSRRAVQRVMADNHLSSPGEAWQVLRQDLEPDIVRLRDWWEQPNRLEGQDFADWLGELMEEQLVIDAVTINPRRLRSGAIGGFEIIDGATIKPLWDYRGARPSPPDPAWQQVLYGFVRGEWAASTEGVAASYDATELVYRPRRRRTFTPYGYPEVEIALSAVDLLLKRIGWIRDEFDEGTMPDYWMKTDLAVSQAFTPDQLRQWETAINESLAGLPGERKAAHLLPKGFEPDQMRNFGETYKSELDEFIIKLCTMAFSVMPTEIGFPPSHGLGGKGHQEGEANSAFRKEIRPSVVWLQNLLTHLSRTYLAMPPALEWAFLGWEVEDQTEAEKVSDSVIRRGGMTLNEDRGDRGQPLFDFPEADEPFVVTGSGLVFLRGAKAAQAAAGAPGAPAPPGPPETTPAPEADVAPSAEPTSATDPPVDDGGEIPDDGGAVPDGMIRVAGHLRQKPAQPAAKALLDEAQAFVRFTAKRQGGSWRPFEFSHVPSTTAVLLNELGAAGELEEVKALVATLGKASARRPPGRVSQATKAKLVAKHSRALADAARQVLPSASKLVAGYDAAEAATKAATGALRAARGFVRSQVDHEALDDVDAAVEDVFDGGYGAGLDALDVDVDEVDDDSPRRHALRAAAKAVAAAVMVRTVDEVAGRLVGDDADRAAAIDATFSPDGWPGETVAVELTAALTAGVQDGAEAIGLTKVRLVAEGGDCEFCAGYDGRIMDVDHDPGMPPLHHGCQCDIEALPPDANPEGDS